MRKKSAERLRRVKALCLSLPHARLEPEKAAGGRNAVDLLARPRPGAEHPGIDAFSMAAVCRRTPDDRVAACLAGLAIAEWPDDARRAARRAASADEPLSALEAAVEGAAGALGIGREEADGLFTPAEPAGGSLSKTKPEAAARAIDRLIAGAAPEDLWNTAKTSAAP